tara:strand:+ start:328 stop:441 length:114 start_codon:yes stop_codon:yes gene_type:complete
MSEIVKIYEEEIDGVIHNVELYDDGELIFIPILEQDD